MRSSRSSWSFEAAACFRTASSSGMPASRSLRSASTRHGDCDSATSVHRPSPSCSTEMRHIKQPTSHRLCSCASPSPVESNSRSSSVVAYSRPRSERGGPPVSSAEEDRIRRKKCRRTFAPLVYRLTTRRAPLGRDSDLLDLAEVGVVHDAPAAAAAALLSHAHHRHRVAHRK